MASGLLFPVMAIIVIVSLQVAAGESETNMVFYMHDNLKGSNLSSFTVTRVNGSSSNSGKFGTVIVMSNVITKIPGSDNIVGRAQGMYVNTNLVTGLDFFMAFTLMFEYNGSTLELQGTCRFDQLKCEYAVVGGTGKFRFARGYAIVTTESILGFNAVLKFNTTFLRP